MMMMTMLGATVQHRPWPPIQSSSNPVDLRSPLANLVCSPSWGPFPCLLSSIFLVVLISSCHCFLIQIFIDKWWSFIHCMWLSQLILLYLTNLTLSAWPRLDLILWFHLSLHSPIRKRGPHILLTILLSQRFQRLACLQFSGSKFQLHMLQQV